MKNIFVALMVISALFFPWSTDAAAAKPASANKAQVAKRKADLKRNKQVNLKTNAGDVISQESPTYVVDSLGNAVAVWRAFDTVNSKSIMQAATLVSGGSWSAGVTISDASGEDASGTPHIAMDSAGNVVVAYNSFVDALSTYATRVASLPGVMLGSFGTWNAPITISDSTEEASDDIVLKSDLQDKFRAAWTTYLANETDSSVRMSTAAAYNSDPWVTQTLE